MTAENELTEREDASKRSREGLISALIAYTFWGLLPIYFIFVKDVDSIEVLSHRIIWGVPFGALIIHFRNQWREVWRALTNKTMMVYLSVTAVLIGGNWLVYILAVQQEQIFQASLGYYINPLMFSLAGVVLFKERLRKAQTIAIWLAAFGVGFLALTGGSFPAIAIFLGTSFTIYGILRKKVAIGGMPGLFIETLVLLPLGLAYLAWMMNSGHAAFVSGGSSISILLILAGPFTVIPLLFFALAAKRLNLTTLGMMQFLAPTLQFAVGVAYGEQLTMSHIVCFAFIWTAVGLFSWDAIRASRRARQIISG